MLTKRILQLLILTIIISSCNPRPYDHDCSSWKVWAYKPIYAPDSIAKKIWYSPLPEKIQKSGNIYAYQNYIFQIEPGAGIHVIDNSTPSSASRIGFINVKGCSQISIKDGNIYINNYEDLVVLKFSANSITVKSKLKGVFNEFKYNSPISQPPSQGYYESPAYGKYVVRWEMDSLVQCNLKFKS